MKYKCALFVVKDIQRSRNFYETLLEQEVEYDFGENIAFKAGFAIQELECFAKFLSIHPKDISLQTNHNAEVYFETEDIDSFLEKLKTSEYSIQFLHELKEHTWKQRVIRFYDPDQHIVEVGESMETVVLRLMSQNNSIEETAKLTQHPIEFVQRVIQNFNLLN